MDKNWRKIIAESEADLGALFVNKTGARFVFEGVLYAADDYYYVMRSVDGDARWQFCSCVVDSRWSWIHAPSKH